ncbi:hypothetical protein DSUL_260036 [Desulfovibrionales bacterium]
MVAMNTCSYGYLSLDQCYYFLYIKVVLTVPYIGLKVRCLALD